MRALRTIGFIVIVLFALTVGFLGGLVTDRTVFLPITSLIPTSNEGTSASDSSLNVKLIEEAFQTIQKNYADQSALAKTNLTYGALTGMVASLGDTGHSRFLTPETLASENRAIQGEFEGIGALLNVNEAGNPVILSPMDGSPAQKAGLRPGDIILEVNGEDVSQAALSEVVRRVLGPAGTQVTLTLRSPETNKVRKVNITRAKIVLRNVTWQMLPGTKVAHIRVAQFSQNVTDDLVKAIKDAKAQGAQGILLDLRNNPGGLLNEAIGVVSQFLSSGSVLETKDAQGKITSVPVKKGGVATDIPMVALINEGSASAAEITAGALQDYDRAELVGQKTFGTGTVLNQFRLSDGSAILLATELWLTPKGRVIWHEGIAPDIEVELPVDVLPSIPETEREMTAQQLKDTKDVQLKNGLDVLQQKMKK